MSDIPFNNLKSEENSSHDTESKITMYLDVFVVYLVYQASGLMLYMHSYALKRRI